MNIYDIINQKRKKQKIKTAKTAALTAAIGVTAGAAAGLLLAPKSGKETREDIANKSIEAKDLLVKKTTATKEAISQKVSEGKRDISIAKEKIAQYLASKKEANSTEELSNVIELEATTELSLGNIEKSEASETEEV